MVCQLAISLESRAQDVQAPRPQAAEQQPDSIALTREQTPPGPIIVSYQNRQLTIEPQNATLSSVLRAACNQTGTALDLPPGADERYVKEQMGHRSIQVTVDTYGRMIPGANVNWVDRLDSWSRQQQAATHTS